MGSIFRLLFLSPLAVLVVLLALANREWVQLSLDPMGGNAWTVTVPLFVAVLGALMIGILVGGTAAWLGQGKYRRAARDKAQELKTALAEVERLRNLVPTEVAIESNTSTLPASMIR